MTTEEIIRELELGNDVTLEKDKTYDFTNYHSIKVKGLFDGNGATIVANELYKNEKLRFLFLLEGGKIINLNIVGPNGNTGPQNTVDYWGAINIVSSGIIINCTFTNCDKWGIKCTSRKVLVEKMTIHNCIFRNIRRSGFGYGIWNQYGDVSITNCKFFNCRHGIDGSSSVFKTYVSNCEFDHSSFIHINMHGDDDQFRGGANCVIENCEFFDKQTPLELKLPVQLTSGVTAVNNCNFLISEDKVGNILHDVKIKGFKNPQFQFNNNTFDGIELLKSQIISGPSKIDINQKSSYQTFGFDSYVWSHGNLTSNINSIIFSEPQVMMLDVYGILNGKRSVRSYKKIEVIEQDKPCFSVFLKGFGCTVEVYRNDILISTIDPREIIDWTNFIFDGVGNYRLSVKGIGTLFVDDWLENNFSTTFEDVLEVKLKYYIDQNRSIGATLSNGERHSGKSSLMLTLPTTNSRIDIFKK